MAFTPPPQQPDLSKLLSQLVTSGLQQKDNPLYQVIVQLIQAVMQFQKITAPQASGGSTDISELKTKTFITSVLEAPFLPNSRQLIAGTGITLDESIANEVTVNSGTGLDYVVMSDGAEPVPSPVDDGHGNFIYLPYTP